MISGFFSRSNAMVYYDELSTGNRYVVSHNPTGNVEVSGSFGFCWLLSKVFVAWRIMQLAVCGMLQACCSQLLAICRSIAACETAARTRMANQLEPRDPVLCKIRSHAHKEDAVRYQSRSPRFYAKRRLVFRLYHCSVGLPSFWVGKGAVDSFIHCLVRFVCPFISRYLFATSRKLKIASCP